MSKSGLVLEIDNPNFTVKLYKSMLRIDLKGSTKSEIEEALENKPVLRQTLGAVLGLFVPLHIHLSDIDDVRADEGGRVKIVLPRHRDVSIPLERGQAAKLVARLKKLIPDAKRSELLRIMKEQAIEKTAEERLELGRVGGATFPVLRSPDVEGTEVAEELEEAEERQVEKEED